MKQAAMEEHHASAHRESSGPVGVDECLKGAIGIGSKYKGLILVVADVGEQSERSAKVRRARVRKKTSELTGGVRDAEHSHARRRKVEPE